MTVHVRLANTQLLAGIFLWFSIWACAPVQNYSEIPAEQSQTLRPEVTIEPEIEFESIADSTITDPQPQEEALDETVLHSGTDAPPEELTTAEPEEMAAQEAKELEALGSWDAKATLEPPPADEVSYDFPVVINPQVQYYLDLFQGRQRKSFARWLSRSSRYLPMIQAQLQEAGLPLDLAYLPMIESGYNLTAYSRARAVGPWQFIRATGRNFGLRIDNYVDERRDPVKSTTAAISYLKALHNEFNSWHLAVAAYNAGEGKIRRAIKKYNTEDFWQISQKKYLRSETKRYVPKLIAAIIIAKSPEEYGFTDIDYEPVLAFESAEVPRWTSLEAISIATNCDYDELWNLNRELRKAITPPDQKTYMVNVPEGGQALLAENLPRVHATVSTEFKTHIVKGSDTIDRICKHYSINKTTLLKANALRKAKLTAGQRLRIPFRKTTYKLLSDSEYAALEQKDSTSGEFILHKIKPGETISHISKRYGVSPLLIASWNGLTNLNRIRAGQQLALFIDDSATTGGKITPMTKSSKPVLKSQVHKSQPSPVQLKGQKKSAPTFYLVKGGDSLWKISRQFQISPSDLKRWNNLDDNLIHPGLRLVLSDPDLDAS